MGDQKVADLLKSARHQSENLDKTKLHPSQPLNVIAGDGMDTPSPAMVDDKQSVVDIVYSRKDSSCGVMVDPNYDPDKIIDKEGGWQPYTRICEICQIERIVGTCNHCGIWQYCSGDDGDNQFDIKVRRRQNGTSAKPSDVESDS